MAKRDNHYELAFEECLRQSRQPYVAVDEARRSLARDRSLKSLDFLVSPASGCSLLVDVKGRRFPSGARNPQYWRNWSTADDLQGLVAWSRCFGSSATPVLVFAYWVTGEKSPVPVEDLFWFRDRAYGFVAIRLDHYLPAAKALSPRWGTVHMSIKEFRRCATPWSEFVQQYQMPQVSLGVESDFDIWQPVSAGLD